MPWLTAISEGSIFGMGDLVRCSIAGWGTFHPNSYWWLPFTNKSVWAREHLNPIQLYPIKE